MSVAYGQLWRGLFFLMLDEVLGVGVGLLWLAMGVRLGRATLNCVGFG